MLDRWHISNTKPMTKLKEFFHTLPHHHISYWYIRFITMSHALPVHGPYFQSRSNSFSSCSSNSCSVMVSVSEWAKNNHIIKDMTRSIFIWLLVLGFMNILIVSTVIYCVYCVCNWWRACIESIAYLVRQLIDCLKDISYIWVVSEIRNTQLYPRLSIHFDVHHFPCFPPNLNSSEKDLFHYLFSASLHAFPTSRPTKCCRSGKSSINKTWGPVSFTQKQLIWQRSAFLLNFRACAFPFLSKEVELVILL